MRKLGTCYCGVGSDRHAFFAQQHCCVVRPESALGGPQPAAVAKCNRHGAAREQAAFERRQGRLRTVGVAFDENGPAGPCGGRILHEFTVAERDLSHANRGDGIKRCIGRVDFEANVLEFRHLGAGGTGQENGRVEPGYPRRLVWPSRHPDYGARSSGATHEF